MLHGSLLIYTIPYGKLYITTFVLLQKLAERRAHRTSESRCARSDVWCFIALSVSDFLFCFSLLPQWYMDAEASFDNEVSYILMYEVYEDAIMNTFLMSSTWLTVSMTINRYLHLCHPIWAMRYLGRHFLVIAIMSSTLFSILFNIPRFWFITVNHYTCMDLSAVHNITTSTYNVYFLMNADLVWEMPYRWCYFFIGIILPLCSLSYGNTRIIIAVCRSMAVEQRRNQERNVITRTLIFVVFFYVCLVSPAELLKFFQGQLNGYNDRPGTYGLVLSIANILQAINFSCNFLPYLVLDKTIRRGMLQAGCQKRNDNRQTTSQAGRPRDYTYEGVTSSHAPNRHLVHHNSNILFSTHAPPSTEMTRMSSRCIIDPATLNDKDIMV